MRKKACLFLLIALLITSIHIAYPQNVHFDSPTNGQLIANVNTSIQWPDQLIKLDLVIEATPSTNPLSKNLILILWDQNSELNSTEFTVTNSGPYIWSSSASLAPGTHNLYVTLSESWGGEV
jgi:hypothetical protein